MTYERFATEEPLTAANIRSADGREIVCRGTSDRACKIGKAILTASAELDPWIAGMNQRCFVSCPQCKQQQQINVTYEDYEQLFALVGLGFREQSRVSETAPPITEEDCNDFADTIYFENPDIVTLVLESTVYNIERNYFVKTAAS